MLKKSIGILLLLGLFSWSCPTEATDVRIALVQDQNTLALQAEHPFLVKDLRTGAEQKLEKGKYYAHVQEGHLYLEKQALGDTLLLTALEGKKLPEVNGRSYDGSLRLELQGDKLLAVNTLELERLLARVLPQKTMPVWPDEAIKAQAVAARSYVLHQLWQHGYETYDLKAMDAELPYAGLGRSTEKPVITKLIRATAGQYLADTRGRPILAVSTSSSGGRTEMGEAVFNKDYSYLQSVKDYDEDSPEHKWDFRISPSYVQNILEQHGHTLGKLANVRLSPWDEPGADRTESGRVRYIIFGGTLGSVKVSGAKLAEYLSLNSNCFEVETGSPPPESLKVPLENVYGMEVGRKEIPIKVKTEELRVWKNYMRSYHILTDAKDEKIIFHGRGKGHGVGLSAWGARGMAGGEEGKRYEEILRHYYPGTTLVKD